MRLVRFKDDRDETVFINPDQVLFLQERGDSTQVHLSGFRAGDVTNSSSQPRPLSVMVRGKIEEVAQDLRDSGA